MPAINEALNESTCIEPFSLWQEWLVRPSIEIRRQLFQLYSPWSRQIASLVHADHRYPLAEWHDYVHFASLGLLQAIDTFDPRMGASFETFASYRVKGAILNGLQSITAESLAFLRRHRSEGRIGSMLTGRNLNGVSNVAVGLAFGYFLASGILDSTLEETNPYVKLSERSDLNRIHQLLPQLTKNERFVIEAHYYQQLSFVDIAALLGVSKPRVTQLHQQAMLKLKKLYLDASAR